MASFVFVLLFPLGFLASSLPEESWGSVKEEVLAKHLLIAKSVERSVTLYFHSFQKIVQVFANTSEITRQKNSEVIQDYLDNFTKNIDNIVVASYLSLDDYSKVISIKDAYKGRLQNPNKVIKEPYLKYLTFGNRHHTISTISPVFRSSISKQPVVLIKTYAYDKKFNKRGIIYAEVDLGYINDICGKINESGKESCIIVDSTGHIVTHPDQDWTEAIKNLSGTKIVQQLIRGKSGTLSFKGSFLGEKTEVVDVGYSLISNLRWGVIIAQPKLELDSPMNKVMITILKWLILGVFLALIIAYWLTQQITKPINSLVIKSQEADIRSETFNLGAIPKNSPAEISKLWTAISSLVTRLQTANKEVKKLNFSLHEDIAKATAKLRATNKYLYTLSSKDHLTKIANRRYFEDTVEKILNTKLGERASLILIDVDKFKFINDEYGHEAGDLALIHIAKIMHKCTRKQDLPARLGGDEFVIYINNCTPNALVKVAENLRKKVLASPINWEGNEIRLSLSIGIVNCPIEETTTLAALLKNADTAMYVSKENGRNHVSVYNPQANTKTNKVKLIPTKQKQATARA